MFPARFDYYRAESVDDALELLEEHDSVEAKLISGGHSLLPMMKSGLAQPDVLVDIGPIDSLRGIEADGDVTRIGGLTTYATIAHDERLWEGTTAFAEAVEAVGDIQVRIVVTIGGNLAHADPASDPPAAFLAQGGTAIVAGPDGERRVEADDFFQGMYWTAVEEGEILTGIEVPHRTEGTVGAYAKKPSPSSGYAIVGVAAVLETDGDLVESARVAANGAMDHAVRLEPVEEALSGVALDDEDAVTDAAERAADDLDEDLMMEDLQASAEFRAQLLRVYTGRALRAACDRA